MIFFVRSLALPGKGSLQAIKLTGGSVSIIKIHQKYNVRLIDHYLEASDGGKNFDFFR
jgi:hypothetical protein